MDLKRRMGQARIRARRLRASARHGRDEALQWWRGAPRGPESVLLVLGCQRSGTTLMTRILDADPTAKVYPEHSSLSASDRRDQLRLAPLDRVARRLAASRFPLVVLKPLVESQNAPRLLAALPRARALWMFRHYADVARSNLAHFGPGNGVKNLRSVFERRPGDWRSEGVSDAVHRVVCRHFSESMDPWDAAALFWWARNALYFELGLDGRPDVRTCRYEELVADPVRVVRDVYRFTGRPAPDDASIEDVSPASVGLGREIPLSPAVSELCASMLARLDEAHEKGTSCGSRS